MSIVALTDLNKPQVYGKGRRADQYTLFAINKNNPTRMIHLGGHQLLNVTPNEDEPDAESSSELRAGRWVQVQRRTAPKTITSIDATLRIPESRWSPAEDMAKYGPNCYVLVAVYNCPDKEADKHFFLHDDVVLDQPRDLERYVGIADDGGVISREIPLNIAHRIEVNNFSNIKLVDLGTTPFWAAQFNRSQCAANCTCDPNQSGYYAGGGATPALFATGDDFKTGAAVVTGIAATNVITDIHVDDSIIIVTFANDGNPLVSATGGIRYSRDGGTTWVAVAGITKPMHGVIRAGNRFVAVGSTNALYESNDGITWTAIANTFTGTTSLAAVDYDISTQTVFIVGADSAVGKAYALNGDLIRDITADVGAPNALLSVKVLGPDHIAIGGAVGYFTENFEFSEGGVWAGTQFGSVAGDVIYAIEGTASFTWFSLNTKIYHRSPLTDMDVRLFSLGVTLVGTITDIAVGFDADTGQPLKLRAVTTAGEILYMEDSRPRLCDLLAV